MNPVHGLVKVGTDVTGCGSYDVSCFYGAEASAAWFGPACICTICGTVEVLPSADFD